MSKSILIVICDFLLLSLLSIANFDKPAKNKAQQKEDSAALREETFVQTQMLETLKAALDAEQRQRASLAENVEKLSKTAEANRLQAQNREKIIREREKQLKEIHSAKTELERERELILRKSKTLEKRVAESEIRNANLQSEIVSASKKLEASAQERLTLERKLGQMREDDASIKTQLQSTQEQLRLHKENLARLRSESEKLKMENKAIEAEKRALSTQLEVAATKTQIYQENLRRAQVMIDVEKSEKDKIISHAATLSQNVSTLATTQEKLSENIVEMRPQTPSEIFAKLGGKFVELSFKYSESGLLGKSNADKKISALPIEIAGEVWLVFDVSQTPLKSLSGRDVPEKLEIVALSGEKKVWNVDQLASLKNAPSTIAVRLPGGFLSAEIPLKMAKEQNIYKFDKCVVVSPATKYYGQAPFMANFTRSDYAKLDVGLTDTLFKAFSPSAGDIALTRNGEAVGIMVSATDLLITRSISAGKTLKLGSAYNKAAAAAFVKK